VAVIDAADGRVIDLLQPGTNGFIRGTLRSFTRARRAIDAGREVPFSLQRTETGRLLLSDVVTGQSIDLRAFGTTNAEAFGRFLYNEEETASAVESLNDRDGGTDMAAVASNNQESRQ
jgi:putative photosynthetic complex assembly protein